MAKNDVEFESQQVGMMVTEHSCDLIRRAVAAADPDHLRWMAVDEAPFAEVGIFRDDHEAVLRGVAPYGLVGGRLEPGGSDMHRAKGISR